MLANVCQTCSSQIKPSIAASLFLLFHLFSKQAQEIYISEQKTDKNNSLQGSLQLSVRNCYPEDGIFFSLDRDFGHKICCLESVHWPLDQSWQQSAKPWTLEQIWCGYRLTRSPTQVETIFSWTQIVDFAHRCQLWPSLRAMVCVAQRNQRPDIKRPNCPEPDYEPSPSIANIEHWAQWSADTMPPKTPWTCATNSNRDSFPSYFDWRFPTSRKSQVTCDRRGN